MAGKSIDDILAKIRQESESRRVSEENKQKEIFESQQKQRQQWVERNRIYESLAASSAAAGAGAGGTNLNNYITFNNTIWLYPIADLNYVLENTSVSYTKVDNNIIFQSLSDLVDFYDEVYLRTEVTNPAANPGYSLGVGTVLLDQRDFIFLKLENGHIVVKWQLMKQITNQSDLPVGGDSPNGTIGYGSVYNDYDLDGVQDPVNATPPSNTDPLRIKII